MNTAKGKCQSLDKELGSPGYGKYAENEAYAVFSLFRNVDVIVIANWLLHDVALYVDVCTVLDGCDCCDECGIVTGCFWLLKVCYYMVQ